MAVLMEATTEYVSFKDGRLDTRFRYLQQKDLITSIQLAAGPTWQSKFVGSGSGEFSAIFHQPRYSVGTVSYSTSGSYQTITITGSGTGWTSDMVGWFLIAEGGRHIFRVDIVTSPTSMIAQMRVWQSVGSYSGQPYRLGPHLAMERNVSPPFLPAQGPFVAVET